MPNGNVQYLDPEIANEGESVDAWQPFVAKPVIPTYDGIKSIRHYFPQYSGIPYRHKAFPCFLYHKTKPAVLASEEKARQLGVTWRKSTQDERARGFPESVWDYAGEWRAMPFDVKFNPADPGTGKLYVDNQKPAPTADLIAAIVAAVSAQFALKPVAANAAAPASGDADHAEFLKFKAWQAAQVPSGANAPHPEQVHHVVHDMLPPMSDDEQRRLLIEAAKDRSIKIDNRWGLDRIKQELDKFE